MASALHREGSSGGSSAAHMRQEANGDLPQPDPPYPGPLDSNHLAPLFPTRSYSPSGGMSASNGRPPTSAEIDAVIAAAMANAPPMMPDPPFDPARSITPLMTNLLPSAVGADGRVNLFIGNLPYRVRWQDLKDLFRKAGTVLRADVSLGPDNRSRGYGTVLMGSREDAARAIDRFNGYMWQTRTLEVRPDRLPPEYEPQPQQGRHAPGVRSPMYTYHNMSGGLHTAVSLPGHVPPSGGPAWLPGQMFAGRPPNAFGLPGAPFGSSPMTIPGSSPLPPSNSSGGMFGLSPGQIPSLGASPLAGSLTAGVPASLTAALGTRRDSLTPFRSISPDPTGGARSVSPAPSQLPPRGSFSMPPARSTSPAYAGFEQDPSGRGPPPGGPPPIPQSVFAPPAPIASPTDSTSAAQLPVVDDPTQSRSPMPPAPGPIVLEGLSHQGSGLGPVDNLHDRVVFVSNLPLTMQWQDLKDLLRPAGIIIRADIATDDNRKPRGFGTALFGTESDAARAVQMFNGKDLGGRAIRVYLERERHMDALHQMAPSPPNGSVIGSDFSGPFDAPGQMSASPVGARLPWALNTAMQNTPTRPAPISTNVDISPNNPHSHTPAFRSHHHPGPISMPPFAPLEHNPLSPLQTRGLPPMTPSMPGFVFNAHPDTPPIPHPFLSPGLPGPFSPGIPINSPSGFQSYNPFLNPAPGAPVNRFPGAGSAQLGTPTTQSFPDAIPGHGTPGAPGSAVPNGGQDYFPQVLGSGADTPSRMPSRPNASPLNARDRLASNPAVPTLSSQAELDALATHVAEISLNEAHATPSGAPWVQGDGTATPPSPLSNKKRNGSGGPNADANEVDAKDGREKEKERDQRIMMRQSLDEHRPSIAHALEQGERRASFPDLGL